jgi:murein DD-endopeptidase MepM/ murein hydrolase activator NlpD
MKMNRDRRFPAVWIVTTLAMLLAAFAGLEAYRVGPPPFVQIVPALPAIGRQTAVTVNLSEPVRGLSHVRVEFVQGDRVEKLAEKGYPVTPVAAFWRSGVSRDSITVEVGRDAIKGLRQGNATIRVTAARAPTWLRHPAPVVEALVLPVRLTPPSLQVQSVKTYVAQGGSELVVYRVGEGAVRDGVRSGEWWFPGYQLPGAGKLDRFAFFAVPYDQSSPAARLVAADSAANQAEVSIVDQFFPRRPKAGDIELTDSFLNKVVPEIMSQTPDLADHGSLLDNFLAINGELRRKQDEELRKIAAKSRPELLWRQPFLMMPNAKVMSSFAEYRTYHYKGRVVDQQVHLGYDLAVTRRSPVPSANSGIVLLARYFGIYGNTVIIDHGCGLMSLYGHLSSIDVSEGQQVARGDILGRTGETGLAGGDHLHFATLLQGLPVDSVEWWDGHWIQDRIARKLGASWPFQP